MVATTGFNLPPDFARVEAGSRVADTTEVQVLIDLDNLFSPTERNPLLDESLAVAFAKKQAEEAEAKRIAEEKRKALQRANSTVTSGSQWGTATKLYYDAKLGFNCVSYVKAKTGIYRTMGWGGRAAIQGATPQVGAVGVLRGYPHAVYIIAINESQITFTESNYISGWVTQRTLSSSYFLGFIYR